MVDVGRHARHITLPEVGIEGQQRLNDASVLIIGAGGLGSPAALYLAAAGVGRLGLVDDDHVDLSNLQRQILHATDDVGSRKVDSAKATLNALDAGVTVETHAERLHPGNALGLLKGRDIVIDGTDNLPTRYLIDDACSLLGIPWVYGSVFRFEGQVSLFNHNGGPCYRDLFPEAPPPEAVPSCEDAGVFGVLPGVIGTLQATEAIKLLLGFEPALSGSLLVYDAINMRFDTLKFERQQNRPPVEDLSAAASMMSQEAWCGLPSTSNPESEKQIHPASNPSTMHHVSVTDVLKRKEQGWEPFLVDVRSHMEHDQARIQSVDLHVPHTDVLTVLDQLPNDRDILIHCKSGMRSQLAAMELIQSGWPAERLFNLDGGILAWNAACPQDIVN